MRTPKINLKKIRREHGFRVSYHIKRRYVLIFSLFVILMIYFFKDASWILRTAAAVGFLLLFYAIDHAFNLKFTHRHYFFALIIATTSFLLSSLYYVHPQYDKIQHFVDPILAASIIYYMISELEINRKTKILITFFVTAGLLGLLEIGEYSLDLFFDLKLQGVYLRDLQGLEKFNLVMDRIDDTMVDMILGVIGSGIYCVSQYLFGRFRKEPFRKFK